MLIYSKQCYGYTAAMKEEGLLYRINDTKQEAMTIGEEM